MTLILTALVKNGICICADKRCRTWSNGKLVNTDNLKKIFLLKNAQVMIFNHGVNKFNGKFWNDYCEEYERSERWKQKNLKELALDFKEFIESDLLQQLSQNTRNFPGNASLANSAFVICGKNLHSGKFEFYELFWSPQYSFGAWTDTRVIGSGEGYKKYLENYLLQNAQSNTVEYWGSVDTTQAKEELKKLFSIALVEQRKSQGDDFSESFDIECISE